MKKIKIKRIIKDGIVYIEAIVSFNILSNTTKKTIESIDVPVLFEYKKSSNTKHNSKYDWSINIGDYELFNQKNTINNVISSLLVDADIKDMDVVSGSVKRDKKTYSDIPYLVKIYLNNEIQYFRKKKIDSLIDLNTKLLSFKLI